MESLGDKKLAGFGGGAFVWGGHGLRGYGVVVGGCCVGPLRVIVSKVYQMGVG